MHGRACHGKVRLETTLDQFDILVHCDRVAIHGMLIRCVARIVRYASGLEFPRGSKVSLESLREHVGVFFQLDEAQSAPDRAVRKIGLFQDDIILGRALKQCELEIKLVMRRRRRFIA